MWPCLTISTAVTLVSTTIISCLDYLRSLHDLVSTVLNRAFRVILLKYKSDYVTPLLKWVPLTQRESQYLSNGLEGPVQCGTPSDATDNSLPLYSMSAILASSLCLSILGDMLVLQFSICFSLESFPFRQPHVFFPYLLYTFTQMSPSHSGFPWPLCLSMRPLPPNFPYFSFLINFFLHGTSHHLTCDILLLIYIFIVCLVLNC